ncbi:MAG: ferrous iron transport protein B [Nitrospirae bacterium]|nr:ferrous iron transport protein B [Nitrospirota bacterium]
MHKHHSKDRAKADGLEKICLVGNPNVGKSAIFGLLTGRYANVSNYPGTTVEVMRGTLAIEKNKFTIVDTPGVNNLIPMSEDEKVTRDILLNEKASAVIQVADTKNLKRSLSLTLQLIEMGLPLVLALNMKDEAASRGIDIKEKELKKILGIDTVSTIAVQRKGITTLKKLLMHPKISNFRFSYDHHIEAHISKIEPLIPETNISRRSIALMLLSGDETIKDWLIGHTSEEDIRLIETLRNDLSGKYSMPLNYVINQQRLKATNDIIQKALIRTETHKKSVSTLLGELTTHPLLGFIFLALVLYVMYLFVGNFGAGVLVDFIEEDIFGNYLNPWAEKIITAVIPIKFFQELFIGPYGIITMALTYAIAIILPITTTFFIAFAILEDSGYLPRLAAMLNRIFTAIGLNGKAVLPLILGLGCDTMATMTTRILDTKKERIIVTLLLALGVPCSAQIGVILGMFGKQPMSAFITWLSVVTGIIIFVGFLAAKVIPGDRADFILELPPIRLPKFSNIAVKTLGRIEWYLKEAVPLFILGTLILFVSDKLKILPLVEKAMSPVVVNLLGLPSKAAESFIMGFLRRDYGAAGLFALQQQGLLNTEQVVVSLVTVTLFIPCIANFFMIVKEQGLKTALYMAAFIFPFAFLFGGVLHRALMWLKLFS